jgi:LysM repeat protein
MAAVLFNLFFVSFSLAEDENEETYSISLVQTAEVARETIELDNKKILTETYTAKEGDHIWQLLRSRDLLKKNKLGGVLSALKKLNPSLSNIDMIHPGEKIIIPLVITPITNKDEPENTADIETVSLKDIENLEYYTVSSGDSLIKIINKKYSIPGNELYDEYLNQLKKLNPGLKDLDHIYPGQKVRLPIYSPKVVRGTIEQKPVKPKKDKILKPEAKELGNHLNRIFTLIGEEYVQQGTHFIPLKTGEKINLNTETYPLINLRNGEKIIVDLFNSLPDKDKMAELIRSNWDNYRIVHITGKDDLERAVAKILSACNYARVYTKDESLVFEDDIKMEITVDWIIKLLPEPSDIKDNIICLNMNNDKSETVPSPLKDFLASQGIKIIDYPPDSGNKKAVPPAPDAVSIDENRNNIVEKILELAGQKYSAGKDIPIYQAKDSDFNLIVPADYYFKRNGKDCIIDLNGIGADIVNILKEHKFLVLPLSGEPDAQKLAGKTLDFLGIENNKNHTFYALPENKKKNVKIIIPGILFKDAGGQSAFISSINLSPDISEFLSMKVDNIFFIKSSQEAE